jgi:hypothetical protein
MRSPRVRALRLCCAHALAPLTLPARAVRTVACAGLERLLTPMVAASDAHVEAVLASQQNLAASIDRLVAGARPGCAAVAARSNALTRRPDMRAAPQSWTS